jgi:hypothetical protein
MALALPRDSEQPGTLYGGLRREVVPMVALTIHCHVHHSRGLVYPAATAPGLQWVAAPKVVHRHREHRHKTLVDRSYLGQPRCDLLAYLQMDCLTVLA